MLIPLRAFVLKSVFLSALLALPLAAVVGCGGAKPERTEDPAEIEKNRLEHVERSQREMEETR